MTPELSLVLSWRGKQTIELLMLPWRGCKALKEVCELCSGHWGWEYLVNRGYSSAVKNNNKWRALRQWNIIYITIWNYIFVANQYYTPIIPFAIFIMYYYSRYLGVTILLSLTVFLNMVAETMPATSDAVPLLGKMILFTNLTGVLCLLYLLYTIYYVICILVILILYHTTISVS